MGRSLWIFDHLSVLRELAETPQSASNVRIFAAPDVYRWRLGYMRPDKWVGENPPNGASIYYWLKEAPKSDYTIDILDAQGNVVNTLSTKPKPVIQAGDDPKGEEEEKKKAALSKEAGMQRAVWDLTYAGPDLIPNARLDTGDPGTGPMALPGTYTVRLNVEGQTATTTLKILPDPRVTVAEADLQEQSKFALQTRDQMSRVTRLVKQMQSVRKQLLARNELLQNNTNAADLSKNSQALVGRINELEEKIHNPKAEVVYDILAFQGGAKLYSRLSLLYMFSDDADGAPTQGQKEMLQAHIQELEGYEAEWKKVSGELTALNDAARKLDLPTILL
jgi:hypothetical protein